MGMDAMEYSGSKSPLSFVKMAGFCGVRSIMSEHFLLFIINYYKPMILGRTKNKITVFVRLSLIFSSHFLQESK